MDLIKITVKVIYLRNTKLWARTFFRVCITHRDPHDAHSLDSKAIYHFARFPRKLNQLNRCRESRLETLSHLTEETNVGSACQHFSQRIWS